jgi:hypothetical protein
LLGKGNIAKWDRRRNWMVMKSKRKTQTMVCGPEHRHLGYPAFSIWVSTRLLSENLVLLGNSELPSSDTACSDNSKTKWKHLGLPTVEEHFGKLGCTSQGWAWWKGIFNCSWVQQWVWKVHIGGQDTCLCATRMPQLKCHSARRGRRKIIPSVIILHWAFYMQIRGYKWHFPSILSVKGPEVCSCYSAVFAR